MNITLDTIEHLEIEDFLGNEIHCECKETHRVAIDRILIEKDGIDKLPECLSEFQYKRALVIADVHTNEVAGKQVEAALSKANFAYKKFVFQGEEELVPDEAAVGTLLIQVEKDTEVIVAIGTGTLNDLAKFVSHKTSIPTIIVATAPSMDGFASTGAALIVDNLKTSFECVCPKAIIGDITILKQAPMDMIIAGFGDIVGKYSALTDWKLGKVINGEYYCDVVEKMVTQSMMKCINNIEGMNCRDEGAIKNLMEALVVTGIAMSFVGNSRPASGSEHHLAHYWEMMFLFEQKKAVLHGTKVGIAAVITARLSELVARSTINFDDAINKANSFDQEQWKKSVERLYQKAAQEIIQINEKEQRNSIDKRIARVHIIQENMSEIIDIVKSIPSAREITAILKHAGGASRPREVGIDEQHVINGILMAKEIRTRYTILNLLSDLGILEKFAHEVHNYLIKEEV
ncbi:sn-glycerol-1-phosphate dehydrogenase [Pelosinus propionicus]|uniref:Glycerol-1-phosphate dehydrogenase [NAD(P)+] n=1 Tax=Pelosinus propionicus DSM 13327 TaxID=1123291 RepID=A0A1I4IXT2_9FIRM|nr:sn-glycerol-1-phosphate dehydrogenase [Pelosinus propionicus]SFL58803.1 glycerol-1-phosphate dehydrogenase [NAD(P)+] [Pelosinus propionicus DSM 13327]